MENRKFGIYNLITGFYFWMQTVIHLLPRAFKSVLHIFFLGRKRTVAFPGIGAILFGRLRKWDWSGLCPFPLRKMTGCEHMGSGNRIIGGGVQDCFWGRGFMVFSPPPNFPSPFVFLREREKKKREQQREDRALSEYCHVYLNSVQEVVSGEYGRGVSSDTSC